jgi:hypothetical protein
MSSQAGTLVTTSPNAKLGHNPPQSAKVSSLADDAPIAKVDDPRVEKAILDHIRKCLAKADHPAAQEDEAQTVILMASRLMQQFNITNADLVEKTADADDLASLGGQSTVSIVRAKDDGKRITYHTWSNDVGHQ